eukprot:scaffold23.g4191.t1
MDSASRLTLAGAGLRRGLGTPDPLPPRRVRRVLAPAAHRGRGGGRQSPPPGGQAWGNTNRLSSNPALPADEPQTPLPAPASADGGPWARVEWWLGELQYRYYNWRQDTWSDLQLFVLINTVLLLGGAELYGCAALECVSHVLKGGALVRVRSLPASLVVLEVLERNVRQGSAVYEAGHVVVLSWCQSEQELSQLHKELSQLCAASRAGAGASKVVVVLTQQEDRYGVQFVFRQGSPLDPAALKMVAATEAKAIILNSNSSRPPVEADALCVRAAVLLDEMCVAAHGASNWMQGAGPVVVVQVETDDGMDMARYSCSSRIIPVPTTQAGPALPPFAPTRLPVPRPAPPRPPRSIVVGVSNPATRTCEMNPPPSYVIQPGDMLMMLCPRQLSREAPLETPLDPGPSQPWDPASYVLRSQDVSPCGLVGQAEYAAGACGVGEEADLPQARTVGGNGASRGGQHSLFVLPVPIQYQETPLPEPEQALADRHLLIAGWGLENKMWELLKELDHGVVAMPFGSRITLVHNQAQNLEYPWTPETLAEGCREHEIRRIKVEHVKCDPRRRRKLASAIDISKYKDKAKETGSAPPIMIIVEASMSTIVMEVLEYRSMSTVVIGVKRREAGAAVELLGGRWWHAERAAGVGASRAAAGAAVMVIPGGGGRGGDTKRLPLGVTINMSSYAAKVLAHSALQPFFLPAYQKLGRDAEMFVQARGDGWGDRWRLSRGCGSGGGGVGVDSSAFAGEGEELSFLALQQRAASVRQVLLGYYRLPATADQPLEVVVNPQGAEARTRLQVFSAGDARCKVVTLAQLLVASRSRTGSTSSAGMAAVAAYSALDVLDESQEECEEGEEGEEGSGGGARWRRNPLAAPAPAGRLLRTRGGAAATAHAEDTDTASNTAKPFLLFRHQSYVPELCFAGCALIFVIGMFLGQSKNEGFVIAWTTQMVAPGGLLDRNFALLGPGDSKGNEVLLLESPSCYKLWTSGRRFCQGMLCTFYLQQRQDLAQLLLGKLNGQRDILDLEARGGAVMSEGCCPPIVLAIATPGLAKQLHTELPDLKAFARKLEVTKDRLAQWPFGKLSVLAEQSSTFYDLMTPQLMELVFGRMAWELVESKFLDRFLTLALLLIDMVGTYKLSPGEAGAARRERERRGTAATPAAPVAVPRRVPPTRERRAAAAGARGLFRGAAEEDRKKQQEQRRKEKKEQEEASRDRLRRLPPEARQKELERRQRLQQKRLLNRRTKKMGTGAQACRGGAQATRALLPPRGKKGPACDLHIPLLPAGERASGSSSDSLRESEKPFGAGGAEVVVDAAAPARRTQTRRMLAAVTKCADAKLALALHNKYRQRHGAAPLAWSATVARSAQALANTCQLAHTPPGQRIFGENIAYRLATPRNAIPCSWAVDLWYVPEERVWQQGMGFTPSTGHFTQMVWKATTQVGCGAAYCPGSGTQFVVCQYNPPGNVAQLYFSNVQAG